MSQYVPITNRSKPGMPLGTQSQHSTIEPLAVRVPVAMQMIGVGRTTLYRLIASGDLRTVKLGRATLITMSSLRRLVEGATAAEGR